MKNEFPFDDFVKEQFSKYSPVVPGHILKNIFAERSAKPKAFWMNWMNAGNIFLLAIILVTGSVGYYFISLPKNKITAGTEKNVAVAKEKNTEIKYKKEINNKDENKTGDEVNTSTVDKKNSDVIYESNIADNKTADLNNNNQLTGKKTHLVKKSNQNFTDNIYSADNITSSDYSPVYLKKILFPFSFANARELNNTKKLNNINLKLPDCPTIEKDAAGNKKYWEVYAGPDFVFNSFKTYGDTASTNYLQKRKASTKFASAFSAGIRYTKVFNNGMSVRSGINYSQVNEKFIYFNPNEIKFITVITTRVIIRSPGDTLYINDTLQYQQSGARTKTTYNRYRNIDIPIVIGYELGNGKIHANINAGVIINIYSWYKGDILDTTYQPVSITTGKGNKQYQYKNNIGAGFLGSVSVYYKLNDQLHLLIEPYFRYNLSPMSNNNSNLQQKFHTTGLRAGLRLDLK